MYVMNKPVGPIYDLIIRKGQIVDGTGAQCFEGDIAVRDGIIQEIGEVRGHGKEEINAAGHIVTPGFVDIHTHYDGQAIWDKHLKPSAIHGVTSVVMGNCGVGFAPCRSDDREKLVELMEGVEDIPAPVMHEGLEWSWETFPEYLDALDRGQRDTDICALLPHAAVRVYVMGDRAIRHEAATAEDMEKMRRLTAEAAHAGAFGFSSSRTVSHKSKKGEHTPTLRANELELTAFAKGLADAGHGFIEMVSDWDEPNPKEEFQMFRRVVEASGRPMVFTCNQRHDGRHGFWKDLMAYARQAREDGHILRPVVAPRPIGIMLGLNGSQNPFSGTPTYRSIEHLPLDQRVEAMSQPDIRSRILSEDPITQSTFPLIHRILFTQMFRLGSPANYTPAPDNSIAAMADRQGITPQELAYDILLENKGRGFLYAPLVNYAHYNMEACAEMLDDPNTIMGLGDGGAHVGFILDAGYPTWLIRYWNQTQKRYGIEETVRRLTSDTAHAAGLHDRGRISVGLKADFNVIDWPSVRAGDPYLISDLPAGGSRLMQDVYGYKATILSGEVTYRDGVATGATPGRLVRSRA
ncbi:MAG TPA: amidohydrolase [Alphaproteobacteria bacterium]|nr:amidohydrolase [Paracoccaceae bacterium]HBQ22400.1 amidohydrolase [Alphaproteobacteria bacterium]HCY47865.1 amidohydrolase [Alphaproteobacteria bacterium]